MRSHIVFHARPVAAFYDLLTGQVLWRRAIESMLAGCGADRGTPPSRVLDLGCGPGESAFALAERWPEAEVVGVDLAPAMIRRARQRLRRRPDTTGNLRFEVADAADLLFDSACFDLAIGHSFLYLVSDRPRVLREALRVLRPGGMLCLMEPAASGSLLRAGAQARAEIARAIRRAPVTAARFGASMVLWRWFSGRAGRLASRDVERLFGDAGFTAIATEPTLAGLGMHCLGRRPAGTRSDRPVPGRAR